MMEAQNAYEPMRTRPSLHGPRNCLQIKKDRRLRRMLSQDAKRGRLLTHKIFCTQKSEVHRQETARAMLSDDGLA